MTAIRTPFPSLPAERGVALIEALIAVLVFSIGVLGLIGLLGISIKSTADAKYRADAAYFANQIISDIWLDQANAASYKHNDGADVCTSAGGGSAASAYATANAWLTAVAAGLPGATGGRQQITVAGVNPITVTVTVCWHGPQDKDAAGADVFHKYRATAQIAG